MALQHMTVRVDAASNYITVPANHYDGNGGEYATISFATIEKLLQIRGHLAEIARLVN